MEEKQHLKVTMSGKIQGLIQLDLPMITSKMEIYPCFHLQKTITYGMIVLGTVLITIILYHYLKRDGEDQSIE